MSRRLQNLFPSLCRCGCLRSRAGLRLAWFCFTAFCTAFAQVRPGPPPLRVPAGNADCCLIADTCCAHAPVGAKQRPAMDCAACVPGATAWAVLGTDDCFTGLLDPGGRVAARHEFGRQRSDPPPLPPPRLTAAGVIV